MLIEADKALEMLQNSPYLYEAEVVKGEYLIEAGKDNQLNIYQVNQGVEHLKQAWNGAKELHKSEPALAERVAQIEVEFRRAAKLLFLK